ncbi:MAG TPA: sporulation protein YqfD [Candidatus Anaerostipes excrementavium]|uniref:Sporulation protein YqfD n=1 Tax=Candidatus Anaerostipes excrementavium TaxID=2838463 RepID=A0A9D2B943_9FIRM|nr:sporulation protein YqfD [uncultured Anaerostipes sp.]HIX66764.1 sporulation protein YqfD [Candidatus Anaerostipes excrementavium]
MVRILHFIFGRLCFEITGQYIERFLNLCAKNNVVLWNLMPTKQGYTFFVRKKSYEDLKNLAAKTNIDLRLTGRYGLPYFLKEHRKRKAFFFSAGMAVLTVFFLSQFVWEITISGSEVYSESDLMKYVTTNFYRPGTWKQKVDCDLLEEHLREDYEEIAWVSCSLQGTRLHVEIKETLDRKTKQNPAKPCDIVANKSGTITALSVKSGTPLVSVGDKVKKGSTLISGLIYYYSDDFQVTETDKIKADGEITMKTEESYKETIPMEYYEKEFEEGKTRIKSIYAGPYEWKLPSKEEDDHVDIVEKKHPLKIGKALYFPVGVYMRTFRPYTAVKKTYTDSQAEKKLENRLERYIEKKQKKGVRVLKKDIKYKRKGGTYMAYGTIVQEEKVGKIRSIQALTKKQEEKIAPTTAAP